MARPRKRVDEERLRTLAMIGASHELIATELGISHDTLTRRFGPLLNESRGKGKLRVLGKAFAMATGGNVRLLELFLVNWLGFTLRPEIALSVVQNAGPQPLITEERKAELSKLHAEIMARAAKHGHDNGDRPPDRGVGLAS